LLAIAWISDTRIAAFEGEASICSHIRYIDIQSGEVSKPNPDQYRILLSAVPDRNLWLELVSDACSIDATHSLELVNDEWKRISIRSKYPIRPPEYPIGHPMQDPSVFLLPSTESVIYMSCEDISNIDIKCSMIKSRIEGNRLLADEILFSQPGASMTARLSPDGSLLALIDYWGMLHVIDVELNLHRDMFIWKQHYGPAELIWSPWSQYIGTILDDPSFFPVEVDCPVFSGFNLLTSEFTPFLDDCNNWYSVKDWRIVNSQE
jgi:hypothetical protein